jgi:outer membrane protein assembly factor BamE
VGQSKQQVIALLGTPSIADPFHAQRWDYTASQRTNRRGTTEIKNLTVFFSGDTVASWEGEYFPENDVQLAQDVRKFGPNLARDKKKDARRR